MIAAQRRSRLSLTAESSPDTIGRARWTAALLAGGGTTKSRLVPHGRGGLKAQPSPSPIDASLGYLLLFKVHLSLIFLLRVFIRHLTLPYGPVSVPAGGSTSVLPDSDQYKGGL